MMAGMVRSHVVTGAGRGVGRAIADRLLADGDAAVVLERDSDGVAWVASHPAGPRVVAVTDSADDLATAERGADDSGFPSGWGTTPRALLNGQDPAAAERTRSEMAEIDPLGRVGLPAEVRTPSRTCCPTARVSSAVPCVRLTAGERLVARTPRRGSSTCAERDRGRAARAVGPGGDRGAHRGRLGTARARRRGVDR